MERGLCDDSLGCYTLGLAEIPSVAVPFHSLVPVAGMMGRATNGYESFLIQWGKKEEKLESKYICRGIMCDDNFILRTRTR